MLVGTTGLVLLSLSAAASARTLEVRPGESIQAAVDGARPGDRVLVTPGTYRRRGAVVLSTRGVRLIARSSRRRPVALIARRRRLEGIVVSGRTCSKRSSSRIRGSVVEGFTLRGFRDGVAVRCASGFRVTRMRVLDSRRHGVTVWRSASGRIDRSVLAGARGAGVRVADSRAVRLDHNLAAANAVGIVAQATDDLRLDHNRLRENNRPGGCAGRRGARCGARPGSGILLVAGDHSRIEANRVLRHQALGIAVTSYCGGLGLRRPRCRELDVDPYPEDNLIASNVVRGGGPAAGLSEGPPLQVDLGWDQTGTGNCWRANTAERSFPATLPACEPAPGGCAAQAVPDCLPGSGPAVEVGIGEQGMSLFDDPLFADLGVRHARIMVPWNLAAIPVELTYVADWLAAARRAGVEPFVQFTRATGSRCPDEPCELPTVAEYSAAFQDFRERFPFVTVLGIWNEANHASQPTSEDPRMAAEYYKAARLLCPGCEIVAADVLDTWNMSAWVASFQHFAGQVDLWGLHNYADANQLPDMPAGGTARFLSSTTGEVWLTETGGIVRRDTPAAGRLLHDEERAARATGRAFHLAALYRPRVSRMYLYNWRAPPAGDRWDSGLERSDGTPRPAWFTVKAALETPAFGPLSP